MDTFEDNKDWITRRLYHGTHKLFDSFSLQYTGTVQKMPLGHLGIYFTPCPTLASKFCQKKWDKDKSPYRLGAHIRPVFIHPKKTQAWNTLDWVALSGSPKAHIEAIRNQLRSQGIDCLIINASDKHCVEELYVPQIIVLDPSIIQPAIALTPPGQTHDWEITHLARATG